MTHSNCAYQPRHSSCKSRRGENFSHWLVISYLVNVAPGALSAASAKQPARALMGFFWSVKGSQILELMEGDVLAAPPISTAPRNLVPPVLSVCSGWVVSSVVGSVAVDVID